MNYEYLLFNIIVLSGPIFFGTMRKFSFAPKVKIAIVSLLVPLLPFLVWDSLVTNRHWYFNSDYIIGFKLFQLPIEEILFFITVPYACLFTWEMLNKFNRINFISLNKLIYQTPILFIGAGMIFILLGKEYTGLVMFSLAASLLYDYWIGANLFTNKNFLIYTLLIIVFTIIFNGYLTWRPVVTYNEIYQLGFRVFTIPIEDFIFGMSLLFISTSTYLKLNR